MTVLARLVPFLLAFFSSLCIMVLELIASRLVARHVGASLVVWTSVIGIILGGICLGNVLGGRLADRVDPRRAIGPLFAMGSALTLGCLWINAAIGLVPGLAMLPWNLGTVIVVTLDFLVPATVLGMISPVVAKWAVEQARKSGSALGDVYMLGALGSIVGTFLAGFWLMYLAPYSTIVVLVAAALALLATALMGEWTGAILGLLSALGLGVGATLALRGGVGAVPGVPFSAIGSDPLAIAGQAVNLFGQAAALLLALRAGWRLWRDRRAASAGEEAVGAAPAKQDGALPKLTDLAALSFLVSMAFMALEMVAGRLVTRHMGSSIYTWTSVIGVLLGGLSLGNFIGGKVADFVREGKHASWLFLAASILTAAVLLAETPPSWLIRNPIGHWALGAEAIPLAGADGSFLSQALDMDGYPWGFRVLFWTALVFFLPALAMGTVSPVVAKLAVERLRRAKRTGTAIGQVYAWGMVGSILGTFLTGFVLIDLLGTKGLILILATTLALAATVLGTVTHAIWAGVPLGLCVIAFLPLPWLRAQGQAWGLREDTGDLNDPASYLAYTDESNYYYIKVTNENDLDGTKRTLVLDNLIHGYFILDHPERLDYDYEQIYALVARRVAEARADAEGVDVRDVPLRTMFLGGGSYTFPRHLQATYPNTTADVAEIDPAVTRTNHIALGLPLDTTIRTTWGDARQFVERNRATKQYDMIFGDAFNDFSVPWHLTTRQFNDKLAEMLAPDGVYMINIIDAYKSDARARAQAREGVEGVPSDPEEAVAEAHRSGGFLGAWVNTARKTFPHVYVFGTDDEPGKGYRETFVVVASKAPLALDDLGRRLGDPVFFLDSQRFQPRPYPEADLKELDVRSRGIILTDDYAPVENLLAPVAASRGE